SACSRTPSCTADCPEMRFPACSAFGGAASGPSLSKSWSKRPAALGRIVALKTKSPVESMPARAPGRSTLAAAALIWQILVLLTAVAMVVVTALPAQTWRQASDGGIYRGFDPNLLSINPQNDAARNLGSVRVSSD